MVLGSIFSGFLFKDFLIGHHYVNFWNIWGDKPIDQFKNIPALSLDTKSIMLGLDFTKHNTKYFEPYENMFYRQEDNSILYRDIDGYNTKDPDFLNMMKQYGLKMSLGFPETQYTPNIRIDYFWKDNLNSNIMLNFNYDLSQD